MKRKSITLVEVADYKNLASALHKAARGKRNRADAQAFLQCPEKNLNKLASDILLEKLPYGRFRRFTINDPKPRIIHAACFEDRIFHHAFMNHAGPVLETAMMPTSYACRTGMGVHKAVKVVQRNLQRFDCYGKADIDGYFASIPHQRLLEVLLTRFKGAELVSQLQRIIRSHGSEAEQGLPIGSLTSQYFANYYLDGLDRLLAASSEVRAHIRYMDDIIWWTDSLQHSRAVAKRVREYAVEQRGIRIKNNLQIQFSRQGVSWCGYRITQGALRLSCRRKRRFLQLRQYWEQQYQTGAINALQLQQVCASVQAITEHTDSLGWRRENLQRHPALDV